MNDEDLPAHLAALATACGIEHRYTDQSGAPRAAPVSTVQAILVAMGLQAHDEVAAEQALVNLRAAAWRRLAPPSTVVTAGQERSAVLHVPADGLVEAELTLEDGGLRQLHVELRHDEQHTIDGVAIGEGLARLPADLPVGYHALTVRAMSQGWSREEQGRVIVTPPRCPLGPAESPHGRCWGWMIQLYATRSRSSWGVGDLDDLRSLTRWSAERGAGFVLCNPLHAAAPGVPQQASPYFPSSRRFTNPLYLAVEVVPEVAGLTAGDRILMEQMAAAAHGLNSAPQIDRDATHRAKAAALELLHAVKPSPDRRAAFARYRTREGQGLEDFATFCALSERHGADWRTWPAQLQHPRMPAVAAARRELSGRVDYHAWLQWLCDEQLAAAQSEARAAGMPIGIIHDLAVGVDPGGADAWALQDHLASGVSLGAPPDVYNQHGQDWALPPLLPERLAETGYAPLRDMLRSVLRHAGGIRIDHILGFFRLFWIPEDSVPADGAYVRYPSDALLGVLALEAQRAGAMMIGEDLGTVGPGVRGALRERGVLRSCVLYFERTADGTGPLPVEDYPELALTTVTTHDLPTAAGWWVDEEVRARAELGLLREHTTADSERQAKVRERAEMIQLLSRAGLVGDNPTVEDLVVAMHAFLARTPSLLVAGALWDAIADPRQPNLPATVDEYPNWRLPLWGSVDGRERAILLEDLPAHPLVAKVARALERAGDPGRAAQTQRSM
ncbi:MAG TPA: 4-alpha-glucanotransferase [Egibacteraceae bacterium]|nr:4-alpha-glucanotransferase [Egibacteraceae bacterium]